MAFGGLYNPASARTHRFAGLAGGPEAATIMQTRPTFPPPARSRSIIATIVAKLVAVCAGIPYALIALGLRFVIARVFFLAGQGKIEGPVIPINLNIPNLPEMDVSIVLPTGIKPETVQMFETQYANLPVSPTLLAYLFTYAEFVLPICLVIGFATRFAALGLLIMTVLTAVYVMPGAFWPAHVYWIAILMVLVSVGPGVISVDAGIRYVYEE
jgi:putative oxidoreductase